MSIKYLHHVCIQTNNYEESLRFYTDILGFEIVEETKDFHGRSYNTWLKLNSFMIELQTGKGTEALHNYNKNSEGIVHMCFFIDNIEEEVKRIQGLGYNNFAMKNGSIIYEVFGGKLCKINAPEGTIIEMRDTEI